MSSLSKPGTRAPRAPGGPAARRVWSSDDRARRGAATGASSRGRCWVTRRYVRTRRVTPPAACASPKNHRSFPRAFRSRFRRARRAAADKRGAPPVLARVPQRARSRADRRSREPSRSANLRGGDPRVCSAERGRTAPPAPIVASLPWKTRFTTRRSRRVSNQTPRFSHVATCEKNQSTAVRALFSLRAVLLRR